MKNKTQNALIVGASPKTTIVQFTRIEVFDPSPAGKWFRLYGDNLQRGTHAELDQGVATRMEVVTLIDLKQHIDNLTPGRDIHVYGVPTKHVPEEGLPIYSAGRAGGVVGPHLLRNKDHFRWPKGHGVVFSDYDPRGNDGDALDANGLLAALSDACPLLDNYRVFWCPSSSSNISRTDGTELLGLRGQRLYHIVEDATDIPRAMKVLEKRLWLAGHG